MFSHRVKNEAIIDLPSTWKDYLLSEIEQWRVGEHEIVLWSLGGAGFVLKTKKATIYIDPYLGPSISKEIIRAIPIPIDPNDIRQIDALIMTHEHEDHCDRNTIVALGRNTKAIFVGSPKSVDLILGWNTSRERVVVMKPYQKLNVKDVKVTALPAKDPNPDIDALTYHLQAGDANLFHSGDSSYFEGYKEIGEKFRVDIALLNLARNPPQWAVKQYMSYCDVVRAAMDLKAKVVIPMHWDMWKLAIEDPYVLKPIMASQNPEVNVVVLKVGDRFEYRASRSKRREV